jgi:hypothetical protein
MQVMRSLAAQLSSSLLYSFSLSSSTHIRETHKTYVSDQF